MLYVFLSRSLVHNLRYNNPTAGNNSTGAQLRKVTLLGAGTKYGNSVAITSCSRTKGNEQALNQRKGATHSS